MIGKILCFLGKHEEDTVYEEAQAMNPYQTVSLDSREVTEHPGPVSRAYLTTCARGCDYRNAGVLFEGLVIPARSSMSFAIGPREKP